MPTYAYACRACKHTFDDFKSMTRSDQLSFCPLCGNASDRVPTAPAAVRGDSYDWSSENRGKGRRISQLDHGVRKPYYAKNRQTAIDEAHRRGLGVIKT